MTLVRLMTFKSAILARWVKISSWTPSAKKAFAFSSLRFSNGSTAMLFSTAVASERAGALRKKEKTAAASAATTSSPIATAAQRTWVRCFLTACSFFGSCALPTSLS